MDPSTLIDVVYGLQCARFTSAAATAIYLYNIMITLDLEVEHIWSRFTFTLPTILYVTNRYVCLVFFLITMYNFAGFNNGFSDTYCKIPFDAVGFMLAYAGWTGLMALRVCALWRQKPVLVWLIQILWVCTMVTVITVAIFAYEEMRTTIAYNPALRICAPTINPHLFKATPIAPAIYETMLTFLTTIKVFDFDVIPSLATLPMLYRVIARDGVIYFVVFTTITVTNMIAWYTLPGSQLFLLCSLYWAIISTFMAKLVLNLRVAHQESMIHQLSTDGVVVIRTGDGIGTYGTPSEWHFAGTMGYRTRLVFGERTMATNAVDPDISKHEDDAWNAQQMDRHSQADPAIPLKSMELARGDSSGAPVAIHLV